METKEQLLPLNLTARYFRVPLRWLREEAQAGRIPHVRAEKAFLFNIDVVERVLLERAAEVPCPAAK